MNVAKYRRSNTDLPYRPIECFGPRVIGQFEQSTPARHVAFGPDPAGIGVVTRTHLLGSFLECVGRRWEFDAIGGVVPAYQLGLGVYSADLVRADTHIHNVALLVDGDLQLG